MKFDIKLNKKYCEQLSNEIEPDIENEECPMLHGDNNESFCFFFNTQLKENDGERIIRCSSCLEEELRQ